MTHQSDSQDQSLHADAYCNTLANRAKRRARVWGLLFLLVVIAMAASQYVEPYMQVVPIVRFLIAGVGVVTLVSVAFWGGLAASFWLNARYGRQDD